MNIYDFDDTIYAGDTMKDLLKYSIVRHPILVIKSIVKSRKYLNKYKKGLVPFEIVKENLLSFLFKIKNREEYINRFIDLNKHKIKKWYLENQKDDDIIISASYELWIKPFCNKIGIKNVIATKTNKTGKIVGKNCKREEKVIRLNEEYPNIKVSESYSDSETDIPMLEIANKPFVVKDDNIVPFKDKKSFNNKKQTMIYLSFALLLCIYLVLFYCYPLTGDDWGKSTGSIVYSIRMGISLWKDFNGRFFGNALVILLKSSTFFKIIFESIIMIAIVKNVYNLINKKRTVTIFLIQILILTMSIFMYRETISWMSGFANYLVPPLAMLIILNKMIDINSNKQYRFIDYFIIAISAIFMNLFAEHTSIFSLVLAIMLIILSLIQNKKIYKAHIVLLIFSAIGCALMFTSPVYWNIMPRIGEDNPYYNLSLLGKIINNMKTSSWVKNMFYDNIILYIGISFIFLINIKNYKKIVTKLISIFYFLFSLLFIPLVSFGKLSLITSKVITNKYLFIFAFVYFLITIYLLIINYKNNKNKLFKYIFYYLASIACAAPLLVADSFGSRCFLASFFLQLVMAISIYYDIVKKNKLFDALIIIGFIFVNSLMLFAAIEINKTTICRENIIQNAILRGEQFIFIPNYKYPLQVLIHQSGQANDTYHRKVFKLYYGIGDDCEIYFLDNQEIFKQQFTKITIMSYEGSNQVTHPSVTKLDHKISGYLYWMAYTPWPKNNNSYENPSIIASNDGINWVIPENLYNPVSGIPINEKDYYSDPFLFYVDGVFELWYRFNPYYHNGTKSLVDNAIIYRRTSINGINWSDPQEIFDSEKNQVYLSISVLKENKKYYVWYSNLDSHAVYRESEDLINWTKTSNVAFSNYDNNVWHSEVKKSGKYYNMLFYSNSRNEVYLSRSLDGTNFSKPCLIDTTQFREGKKRVYKSSYIEMDNDIYLYVPYENMENGKTKWEMYFKEYTKSDLYNSCFNNEK